MPVPEKASQTYYDIGYLMITKCSSADGSECEYSRTPSIDANTFVPMYDHNRGVHYISGHCAMCNGARDVTPWNVELECSDVSELTMYRELGVVNSTKSLLDAWNSGKYFVSQSHYRIRLCYSGDVTSTCPSWCHNETLIWGCESGYQGLTTIGFQGEVYKNGYCAACNAKKGSKISCGVHPKIGLNNVVFFSLTFAFDFDPRKGRTANYNARGNSPDNSILRCQARFVLDGSDCIPEASNITVTIYGTIPFELSQELTHFLLRSVELLEYEIQEKVASVMETFSVYHTICELF